MYGPLPMLPRLETSPKTQPEGELTAFDIVVGGNTYGYALGFFGDGWFQADSPVEIVEIIPNIKNKDALLPLFTGRIDGTRTIDGVGTLSVDTANFKISLEITQEQSVVAQVPQYQALKATENTLALQNHMFLAGGADTGEFNFSDGISMTHDTAISKGGTAFQSSGNINQQNGYTLKSAFAKRDFKAFDNDLIGAAGLMESKGSFRFARSLDFTGLRIESNQDLIYKDEQFTSSNLEVFLPRHARVEIYRNSKESGEILFSRIMDFGTTQIDTRNFPQGSYDIEIVTQDDGGEINRETRPFTKTSRFAPWGKPILNLEAGVVRDEFKSTNTSLINLLYRKRLKDWLEASVGAAVTSSDQIYETSLNIQRSLGLFKYKGLLDVSFTAAIAQFKKLAGLEASANWTDKKRSLFLSASKTYDQDDVFDLQEAERTGRLALSEREALNFSLTLPASFGDTVFQTGFSGEISRSESIGHKYRYGPFLNYTLPDSGSYHRTLRAEYLVTDEDQRALLTLNFRHKNPVWTRYASMSARKDGDDTYSVASAGLGFSGTQSGYDGVWKNIDANVSLRGDPLTSTERQRQTFLNGETTYTAPQARFLGFINQNLSDQDGQVTGELESTMFWTPQSGFSMTSENPSPNQSMLVIKLNGPTDSKFGIKVNDSINAYGKGGESVALSLEPYEELDIHVLQDKGDTATKIKNGVFKISGFPGNIIYREVDILKAYILIGTLIDANGQPLMNSKFTYQDEAYYSDEQGMIALEIAEKEGDDIVFKTENCECSIVMPTPPAKEVTIEAGSIPCNAKAPDTEPDALKNSIEAKAD